MKVYNYILRTAVRIHYRVMSDRGPPKRPAKRPAQGARQNGPEECRYLGTLFFRRAARTHRMACAFGRTLPLYRISPIVSRMQQSRSSTSRGCSSPCVVLQVLDLCKGGRSAGPVYASDCEPVLASNMGLLCLARYPPETPKA